MIHKSYLIEQDMRKLEKNISLFYGENLGLIDDFKQIIKKLYKNSTIIRLNEEEIIKKNIILFREINNKSLFKEEKIIFIDQVTDKLLDVIKEAEKNDGDSKIYLFSGILEKKSKIRNYFEKSNHCNVIPCYEDNEITLKKIIIAELKNFQGLTSQNINMIIENTNLSRARLKNELQKIKDFFQNKSLNSEDLEKLLNIKTNDNFDKLKDAALLGNKKNTNRLLSDTIFEAEKNIYYLNTINQRLIKLLEINNNNNNLEKAVSDLRPPIFWKDKQNFISQAKMWNKKKIKKIMKNTYDIEMQIKTNSLIDKQTLIKKLLIDLCDLANAS
tara:strand:- start:1954 stop:2940 length:987 start_codon:yes stop_codon:yes gene_type:complete